MTQALAIPSFPTLIILPKYRGDAEPLVVERKISKQIENIINSLIKSRKPLAKNIHNLLPQIFDIRFKFIKWAIEKNIDLQLISESVLSELDKVASQLKQPDEVVLFENAKFALKTFAKVLNSITAEIPSWTEQIREDLEKGITISYEQLKFAIELEPLPEPAKSIIIRLIDVSLSLEFALILSALYIFKELRLSKARIIELSKLLRDWTQEYGAMAMKLQLWKSKMKKVPQESLQLTAEEIEEEQKLADAGISYYLNQIIQEEENE